MEPPASSGRSSAGRAGHRHDFSSQRGQRLLGIMISLATGEAPTTLAHEQKHLEKPLAHGTQGPSLPIRTCLGFVRSSSRATGGWGAPTSGLGQTDMGTGGFCSAVLWGEIGTG